MRHRSRSRNYESERDRGHKSSKYDTTRYNECKSSDKHKEEYKRSRRTPEKSRYDGYRLSDSEDKCERSDTRYKDFRMSRCKESSRDNNNMDRKSYKNSESKYYQSSDSDRSTKKESKIKSSYKYKDRSYKDGKNNSEDNEYQLKEKSKEKEKKIKKKSRKTDKEKKKRKKIKLSPVEKESNAEKLIVSNRDIKSEFHSNTLNDGRVEMGKLEPFKIKETAASKTQMSLLGNSNFIVKAEPTIINDLPAKPATKGSSSSAEASRGNKVEEPEERKMKKDKEVDDRLQKFQDKKKHSRLSHSKESRSHRTKDVEDSRYLKTREIESTRKDRSRSPYKDSDYYKKDKHKSRDRRSSHKSFDDKKRGDDIYDDERLELPRTPTDAQFAGIFTRLNEESVSETEIEDILPPALLDDQMKALLENDPNVTQELWDSEDDLLNNKSESFKGPKHRSIFETLSVPWKTLVQEASVSKLNSACTMKLKNDSSTVFHNIGISERFAGTGLLKEIQERCSIQILNPIAALHQSLILLKCRKRNIFTERLCYGEALSARKDLIVRKILVDRTI